MENLFSPAFGLIRLPFPSVRTHDNSRTERVRGFKFCVSTNHTNSAPVSEVGPNRVTRRPSGILITTNVTRFESLAYKYRTWCFEIVRRF
jgi:hypothetical protein